MPPPPSSDDLRAYCRGALVPERFAAVERWLDGLPAAEVERLLSEAAGDADTGRLSGLGPNPGTAGFITDGSHDRQLPESELGAGGMATVSAARDRALDRVVALKVLRPRQPRESLERFHLREACFRSEAAVTASLEHPAIVPIYDIGTVDGLPAFTMKRIAGSTLETVVAQGSANLSQLVACLLQAADGVAFAHSRGIVHRDLTPANLLIAEFGAVYVLDWGLAGRCGDASGARSGTPAWMAPEQAADGPADPRLDVFGLGALLLFILTGHPPRAPGAQGFAAIDFSGLDGRVIPPGLAALTRRCLDADAANRYVDAREVAAELRRWLNEGLTFAQSAGPLQVALQRFRRSPHTRDVVLIGLLAVMCVTMSVWALISHGADYDTQRISELGKDVPLDREDAVRVALEEVRSIHARHPRLEEANQLALRFEAALEVVERNVANARLARRVDELLARTRTHGQWPGERKEWREILTRAGLGLATPTLADDQGRIRNHPLRGLLVQVAAFRWRAETAAGATGESTEAALLTAVAGPTPGWQALGRLMGKTQIADREPVFSAGLDSDLAIADADAATFILSTFAPDERLVAYARRELAQRPGAFWPLISSARAHLMAGDLHAAQHEAMIASGAEPGSLFPQAILAYVALRQDDHAEFEQAVRRGLSVDPELDEMLALKAVLQARDGHLDEAARTVARVQPARLHYQLAHPASQPMGISVAALVALGLIPATFGGSP